MLCVGGINPSLTNYERTSFSSYGPSADGRQKPNVTAFAYAWTAATGKSNDKFHLVPGTSFSCPLVAGFAACALQAKPNLKAMELLHEIEKSADLYPYCDYSFGYGVPQADYFTGDRNPVKPTFKLEKTNDGKVRIIPLKDNLEKCYIFVKNCRADGSIIDYNKIELLQFTKETGLTVGCADKLTVHYNGYTESIQVADGNAQANPLDDNEMIVTHNDDGYMMTAHKKHFSNYLKENNRSWEFYVSDGVPINLDDAEMDHNFWSPSTRLGVRRTYYLAKAYGLGWAINYGTTSYNLGNQISNIDSVLNVYSLINKIKRHQIVTGDLEFELYQRVRLRPGGIFHKGWHWDLGVYGSFMCYNYYHLRGTYNSNTATKGDIILHGLDALTDSRWNYGVTTRISRDWLGIYARYRLNGIGKTVAAGQLLLPRLEVGLQLAF